MSAHVKPRIATHFAYPLEPGEGLGASCGARTAPADLTVTGLARELPYSWAEQENSIGFPQYESSALGGFTQRLGRTKAVGLARSEDFAQRRPQYRTGRSANQKSIGYHHRSSTLAKFPENSLLFVKKFPARCSKIPCFVAQGISLEATDFAGQI
jgi:hypothetical protein